jgi:hypothetical protein
MKGSIHYAKFENSVRLQRMLDYLLDGKKHSTLDIILGANVCAVNSAACELRENGFDISCQATRPAFYWLPNPAAARKLRDRLMPHLKEAA